MRALEEAKRHAALQQRDSARLTELDKKRVEVRSHALTLREGELDSRIRDRDRTIADLHLQLRELNLMLKKQQALQAAQGKRNAFLEDERVARGAVPKNATRSLTPRQTGRKRPKRTGLRSKRSAGEKGRLKTSKSRKRPLKAARFCSSSFLRRPRGFLVGHIPRKTRRCRGIMRRRDALACVYMLCTAAPISVTLAHRPHSSNAWIGPGELAPHEDGQ
jgi:hypothetical protein